MAALRYIQLGAFTTTTAGTFSFTGSGTGNQVVRCETVDLSEVAQANIIKLPNGAIFDPNSVYATPVVPGDITANIMIRSKTGSPNGDRSYIAGKFAALTAMVGIRGTLTAFTLDGDTPPDTSCTARLMSVETQMNAPFSSKWASVSNEIVWKQHIRCRIVFRQITIWA